MAPLTADDRSTGSPASVARTVSVAEELLTRRGGAPVRLADPEDLGGSDRSLVLRVRVVENPFSLPHTLVLKHYLTPPGAGSDGGDAFRFEAASFQLGTALPAEDRASPALVANDPEHRLLVLEDLGRCASVADRLQGDDAKTAERALLGWARSLGHLQASTAGREGDFGALLRRFGVRSWRDPLADDARAALAEVPDQLARLLRVEAAPAAVAEARAAARLLGGTAARAFSPSEVCPENCLVTGGGSRFLDFEWGSFRDVTLSAASLRIPFPGCGTAHRLPPGMSDAMTASWRSELATVFPDLAHAETGNRRLLQAELLWVWLCTRSLLPRVAAGEPGPDQFVVTDPGERAGAVLGAQWRRLRDEACRVGGSDATAELADAVDVALGPHGGDEPLPLFPAFRARP